MTISLLQYTIYNASLSHCCEWRPLFASVFLYFVIIGNKFSKLFFLQDTINIKIMRHFKNINNFINTAEIWNSRKYKKVTSIHVQTATSMQCSHEIVNTSFNMPFVRKSKLHFLADLCHFVLSLRRFFFLNEQIVLLMWGLLLPRKIGPH